MLRNRNPKRDLNKEPIADPGQVTGFQSPARDYAEDRLHIEQRIVKDPINTFYMEMTSDEMQEHGICCGALLIVDKSVTPKHGSIVIVYYEGEWLVRMLINNIYLMKTYSDSKPIKIGEEGINIFGVVTWCCNPLVGENALGLVKLNED